MAGPSIGTWVKVKNKSGRMTSRVIPNKFGGGGYSQGEVVTQSEFNKVQEKRAEANQAGSGDRQSQKLGKAALSKQEKAQIMLKRENQSRLTGGQINRATKRAETNKASQKAENTSRRRQKEKEFAEFTKARKAAQTKR